MDPVVEWLDALDHRHLKALSFQEVRRAAQALSSLYVERRSRIGQGSALDGAGKRAAFATYYSPLHFLLVRHIVGALDARQRVKTIIDLGCGTGAAGAAWALEIDPHPVIHGIDRNPWCLQEAAWTCSNFGLKASFHAQDLDKFSIPPDAAVLAAFALNEIPDDARERLLRKLTRRQSPVLVIEPIAKRAASWWSGWTVEFLAAGGREDKWRFVVELPERLALMDKATGLRHGTLTGRSLWIPGPLR
jgi:hypothetical protein